jgi:hypothetical protein
VRLESQTPLEESLLWRWERRFYEHEGTGAWTSGTVPWRITSTPLLAEALAEVIAAFVEDLRAAGRLRAGERVGVLDLGAGTGRLAFLLSRALGAKQVPFRLVLTDLARRNLEAARTHPQLRPLFDAGVLDVALADVSRPFELELEVSGERWREGAVPGPLVAVGTYLLDSLPHQLWRARRGALEEGLVTLEADDAEPRLEDVRWRFDFRPGRDASAFARSTAATLGDGHFLVPTGAFACLAALERLAAGRLLSLWVDKGPRTPAQLREVPFPGLARHGCVSGSVNFQALRAWAGWRPWLEPETPRAELGTYGLVSGVAARKFPRTFAAFRQVLGRNQPWAAYEAVNQVEADAGASLEALLHALEETRWSPDAFVRLAGALRAAVSPSPAHAEALALVAERVWANHFELGEQADLAFELAAVLHRAGALVAASRFYALSARERGEHETTLFNLALCRLDLGLADEGRALLARVLELAPGHFKATRVLESLE